MTRFYDMGRSEDRKASVTLPAQAIIAAGLCVCLSTGAIAEDIPEPPGASVFPRDRLPETALPVSIWSGPYAGTFVGYNVSHFDDLRGASFEGDGFVAGAYGGFNFQSGNIVYGIEGDIGGGGFDAAGRDTASGRDLSGESNIFGSLRGRVGVDVDPFLVYGTAGLAVAQTELTIGGVSDDRTSTGYTLGAGVEAKITDSVDTRLEYRYSDYGSADYDFRGTSVSSGFDEHSVRAGVSLKF